MSKNGTLKSLQLDVTTTFKKLPDTAPPGLSGMVKSSACLLSFGGLTGFQRPFFACFCGTVTSVSELRMTKATGTPMVELQVADQHGCSLPLNVLGEWADAGYSEGQSWVFCFVEAKTDESRKSELLCWVYDSAYVFQAPLESAPEDAEAQQLLFNLFLARSHEVDVPIEHASHLDASHFLRPHHVRTPTHFPTHTNSLSRGENAFGPIVV